MAIWHLETWKQLTSRLRLSDEHLEPGQKGFTRLYFRLWRGQIILCASVTHLEVTSISGSIHGNIRMDSGQVDFSPGSTSISRGPFSCPG